MKTITFTYHHTERELAFPFEEIKQRITKFVTIEEIEKDRIYQITIELSDDDEPFETIFALGIVVGYLELRQYAM